MFSMSVTAVLWEWNRGRGWNWMLGWCVGGSDTCMVYSVRVGTAVTVVLARENGKRRVWVC